MPCCSFTGDEKALLTSGSLMVAYGAGMALATPLAHKLHFTKEIGSPAPTRHYGYMTAALGATDILIANTEGGHKIKKNVCKLAGLGWLGGAAMTAANIATGHQKRDVGIANAALGTATGAVLLWRGFRKDTVKDVGSKAVKEVKSAAKK